MTDVDDHEMFSPDELRAAEYALGVVAGTERDAAAQRVARDVLLRPWSRPGKSGLRPGQRNSRKSLRRTAAAPEILAKPHVLARLRDRERTRGRLPRRPALSQRGLATSGARRFY